MKQSICFIGAGNLATHLSKVLHKQEFKISQVYSRTGNSARALAREVGAEFTTSTKEIRMDADIFFVALKDAVFDEVLSGIDFKNKLVVHCSGSLPLSVLEKHSENIGVLYPLQTFSKSRKLDFKEIPVFIEASSDSNKEVLWNMAKEVSNYVAVLSSEKRKSLHIAAVFACNFVNHMYNLASIFLESEDISFDVLKPLIEETAAKVQEMVPRDAQTGPAVRFDENIIRDHLEKLKKLPGHQELYNSISKSIFEQYQENYK